MPHPHPTALRTAFAVLLASAAAFAQAGPCRVTVNVTDNYGNPVEADHIHLTIDGVVTYVPQNRLFQAKCGRHTLHVEVAGANSESLPINLEQLDQVVPVALELGAVDGPVPDCAILGKTSGQGTASTVRLLQLFGLHLVDVPLTAAKTFQFMHLECGTYLLVAMSGKQYLGSQVVTATGYGAHVDLKIADAAGHR